MNRQYSKYLTFIAIVFLTSCYVETKLLVKAEFQAYIQNDNYTAPVAVNFENNSTGADFYQWTFEGGVPASSAEKNPAAVVYDKAGRYTVKLEAWNNTERDIKEYTFMVDSAVHIGFKAEILVNNFVPAEVRITNQTDGASSFEWIFEGGVPAASSDKDPGIVRFNEAGNHKITLTVNNGRQSFSASQILIFAPGMELDFGIEPSPDDFDYEVPFTAYLRSKSTSVLNYEWSATGGMIDKKNEKNTKISFTTPGTYTIRLQGNNEKETQTEERQLTLKPNTNLYVLRDIKFGIKKAEATTGSFYSLSHRSIIKKDEVEKVDGKDINLVFFGLNESFERCYFTSPDDVLSSGFTPIQGATKTWFVNDLSLTPVQITSKDFESITDDSIIKGWDIKSMANSTSWFTNVYVPRFILFETEAGIKGIINIKGFVSQGDNSYILTDIKVQKEKNK